MIKKIGCVLMGSLFQALAGFEGTYGHVFDILEEDLLTVIETRLQTLARQGKIKQAQEGLQKRTVRFLERPTPVQGVTRARAPRTWLFDPSIAFHYDLQDHHHKIFYKANTRFNPLKIRSLTKKLLFLDGDAKDHIAWARAQEKAGTRVVWILVKGSPFKLSTETRTVFFDQQGALVKKLGICHVPASVHQEKMFLRVTEHVLDRER